MPPTGSEHSALPAPRAERREGRVRDGGRRLAPRQRSTSRGWRCRTASSSTSRTSALVISELGLSAEDGASYICVLGRPAARAAERHEGRADGRRLRFRVAGDPARPAWKIDGFFLLVSNRDAELPDRGGRLLHRAGDRRHARARVRLHREARVQGRTDDVHDRRRPDRRRPAATADGEFDYLLVQAFFKATIGPLGGFELTGLRVLYARNMLPKLNDVDRESRELRYYRWYRESDPLTVPGDRRLAAWRAEKDSWAFGVGASASFAGARQGRRARASSCSASRARARRACCGRPRCSRSRTPRPIGFAALEVDRHNDRTSLLARRRRSARARSSRARRPGWTASASSPGRSSSRTTRTRSRSGASPTRTHG